MIEGEYQRATHELLACRTNIYDHVLPTEIGKILHVAMRPVGTAPAQLPRVADRVRRRQMQHAYSKGHVDCGMRSVWPKPNHTTLLIG